MRSGTGTSVPSHHAGPLVDEFYDRDYESVVDVDEHAADRDAEGKRADDDRGNADRNRHQDTAHGHDAGPRPHRIARTDPFVDPAGDRATRQEPDRHRGVGQGGGPRRHAEVLPQVRRDEPDGVDQVALARHQEVRGPGQDSHSRSVVPLWARRSSGGPVSQVSGPRPAGTVRPGARVPARGSPASQAVEERQWRTRQRRPRRRSQVECRLFEPRLPLHLPPPRFRRPVAAHSGVMSMSGTLTQRPQHRHRSGPGRTAGWWTAGWWTAVSPQSAGKP